jgi:hypothetical protein
VGVSGGQKRMAESNIPLEQLIGHDYIYKIKRVRKIISTGSIFLAFKICSRKKCCGHIDTII